MTSYTRIFVLCSLTALAACSSRTHVSPRDAGSVDASADDAASLDSGAPIDATLLVDSSVPNDAQPDANVDVDLGATDAGNAPDSGVRDGGSAAACAPMDAVGEGACDAFFGYAWNGSTCYGISGCDCAGVDCASTYESTEECVAAHAGCSLACGGRTGVSVCPDGQYCDYPLSEMCGAFDSSGTCTVIPELCSREYVPVCGCDGVTYSNSCVAANNVTGVMHFGTCEGSEEEPVPPEPPAF